MAEYVEPTNVQLARFLTVYVPATAGLDLHPDAHILEHLLKTKPETREMALKHHRKFHEQLNEIDRKMKAGQLRCPFIRPNGKPCPNHNQPGSYYCGLHIDSEDP